MVSAFATPNERQAQDPVGALVGAQFDARVLVALAAPDGVDRELEDAVALQIGAEG